MRRTARKPRTGAAIPALVAAVVVVGVLAFSASALIARAGEPVSPQELAQDRAVASAAATAPAEEPVVPDGKREAPVTHVTFGAHTSATQECQTCHPDEPSDDIACRSCHANVCGKDAKTVSDCLECHKTGTTDKWVAEP